MNAQQLAQITQQHQQTMFQYLSKLSFRLQISQQTLQTLGPQATLNRGYAIALKNHNVLQQAKDASIGDTIQILLAKGQISAIATEISDG